MASFEFRYRFPLAVQTAGAFPMKTFPVGRGPDRTRAVAQFSAAPPLESGSVRVPRESGLPGARFPPLPTPPPDSAGRYRQIHCRFPPQPVSFWASCLFLSLAHGSEMQFGVREPTANQV